MLSRKRTIITYKSVTWEDQEKLKLPVIKPKKNRKNNKSVLLAKLMKPE